LQGKGQKVLITGRVREKQGNVRRKDPSFKGLKGGGGAAVPKQEKTEMGPSGRKLDG